MNLTIKQKILFILSLSVMVVVLAALFITGSVAYSGVNGPPISTANARALQPFTFFSATTTTATSTTDRSSGLSAKGLKRLTVVFSRGGATSPNTGSTLFRLQASPDAAATRWYDLGLWLSPTSTSQTFINGQYGAALSLSGTTSQAVHVDLEDAAWVWIRCIAIETTDGEHSCEGVGDYF